MEVDSFPTPPEIPSKVNGPEESRYQVIQYRADYAPEGERFLPGLYLRLKNEGIFNIYFHDTPDITFGEFVVALAHPNELTLMVVKVDGQDVVLEHVGLATLSQIMRTDKLKRGMGGFLFFKDYWNRKDSTQAGWAVLDYWFDKCELDMVGGLTPKLNRSALAFIHRLGFVSIGDLPDFAVYDGKRCPSVVSYMTRAIWQEKRCHSQPQS